MSDPMIRKQMYIHRRQNIILKQLAKQRGVSEAEIIRQAIEREAETSTPVFKDSKKALDEIISFALALRARSDLLGGDRYQFQREALYEDREKRYFGTVEEK
jgi:hypothetical protein